jgi:hypothetical protein
MLLTALAYHLKSRKMSAIEESATTLSPTCRLPTEYHRSVTESSLEGTQAASLRGTARVRGEYGTVANVRFGKQKAGMHVRFAARCRELRAGSLRCPERNCEDQPVVIPGS